ncbi:MAG: hypothetical protein ABI433_10090 [Burkholderiaceae bacterium]
MTDTPDAVITSRSEFHAALREAFAEAASAGCRELFLCDSSFADWPLGERAVVESLAQWAQSHRRLTLLAEDFAELSRRHPRWVEWRQTWAHVAHCRTNTELEAGQMPTILLAPGHFSVRLSDPVHYRGQRSHQAAEGLRCREMFDAVLQRSEEAFPASTTGL